MNSKAIAACFILSVAVCDDKLPPRGHAFQQRQLPIHGLPKTPPCGSCLVVKLTPEFLAALKIIGPVYNKAVNIAATVRTSNTTDMQATKANLAKCELDLADTFVPAMKQLSAAAASIGSCPPLKAFFDNLGKNLNEIFTAYAQDWPSFVTGTDVASMTDATRKTVTKTIPIFFTAFRDLLYNMLQATPLCSELGPIIYLIFDPNGIGVKLFTLFLNSGGRLATTAITSIFGSFIPGNQALGGSLNLFEVMPIVFCAGLGAVVVGLDLGEATAGFCPAGSMGGNYDPVGILKELLCRFLIVIEPSADDDGEVCATGSSQGGNAAGSQDSVGGLLCGVLNLLGLGILLECPKAEGPTSAGYNAVQVLTGLICKLQEALSSFATNIVGFSIPFCSLG